SGLPSGPVEAETAAAATTHDPRPCCREGASGFGAVAGVGHEDLRLSVPQQGAEAFGDARRLVPDRNDDGNQCSSDASIGVRMKIPMPAAVLAGGASRRMGVSKAALPYGTTTLLAHQTRRLAGLFEEVVVAVKETPEFDFGPARIVVDSFSERAPLYGLLRALEETQDRIFVLAVDLPLLAEDVI